MKTLSKTSCFVLGCIALFLAMIPRANAGDNPNHLEPVTPYDHSGVDYYQVVFKTLIKDRFPEAWMLVSPSFMPEYVIILRKLSASDSGESQYQLEYAIAEKPIWNWKDIGEGKAVLDLRDDVEVIRRVINLPDSVAEKLISVWRSVVKQTRYADDYLGGLDGVSYDFYVQPLLFGSTWSPESGVPLLMVNCGEMLIQYVTADNSVRDTIIKHIVELTDKLSSEAD